MKSKMLGENKIYIDPDADSFSNNVPPPCHVTETGCEGHCPGTLIGPNMLSYGTTLANVPNTQMNLMKKGRRGGEQIHDAIHNNPHTDILPKYIFSSGLKPPNSACNAPVMIRGTVMRQGKTTSVKRKAVRSRVGVYAVLRVQITFQGEDGMTV